MEQPLDIAAIAAQFPALSRRIHGHPLVYLDSASTAQKPFSVISAMTQAFEATANIHRGVHSLSVEVTDAYELSRDKVARFLGAKESREIVFVRGTTEAINLVAQSYGRATVKKGDEVLVTELEHHSNLVPWQALCAEKGAHLKMLPINDDGDVLLERLDDLLTERTRIVAVAHVSNSLGTVLPIAEITKRAKTKGAIVVVDGAQAVPHLPVDVHALGCDFYAFSGHKLYGPTGAGALYGRYELLRSMPPWQYGGDMVSEVRFEGTTFREAPYHLEAGTPNIVGVIGLGAAIDWISAIGMEKIAAREREVLKFALAQICDVPSVHLIGNPKERVAVIPFMLGDIHPHDVGTSLDVSGIAVRTGHHCAQPAIEHFGLAATVRASLGIHTTEEEIEKLVVALRKAREVFSS